MINKLFLKTLVILFISFGLSGCGGSSSSSAGADQLPAPDGPTPDESTPDGPTPDGPALEPIAAPDNIKSSFNGTEIKLQWDSVANATGYRVYQADETFADLDSLDNASLLDGYRGSEMTNVSEYLVSNLDLNKSYFFVVTAFADTSGDLSESERSTEIEKIILNSKMNDTGILACGNQDPNNVNWSSSIECENVGSTSSSDGLDSNGSPVPGGQDAHFGRDLFAASGTLAKQGGGSAGFDFTLIANDGNEYFGSGNFIEDPWSCVKDNVTGLIWEVKLRNETLRDFRNTYSWYSPDASDKQKMGTPDQGRCYDSECDTHSYIKAVNEKLLCGHSDWRLPTVFELVSIVNYGKSYPAIDKKFFPNTYSGWHWTSRFGYWDPIDVSFDKGGAGSLSSHAGASVRLVHYSR